MSIGTAANVAAGYDYSLSHQQVIAILLLAFILVVGARLYTPKPRLEFRVAARVFFGTLSACVIGIYLFTNLYADAGLKPDYWNQSRGYRRTEQSPTENCHEERVEQNVRAARRHGYV